MTYGSSIFRACGDSPEINTSHLGVNIVAHMSSSRLGMVKKSPQESQSVGHTSGGCEESSGINTRRRSQRLNRDHREVSITITIDAGI